ncbi:ClpP/crotonase [Choiromyces venosus 120613-1]|uniref:ClpP/crotonase n=1 Tax=Choiromyces venosus 120613-1 TaxID=1336337 RepID=A0A3N4K8Q3_9PEZI|nr:ClpP/crotonase [Choiromyces venosus 120613-1]
MSEPILLEVKKNVALITLNQPKKLNALTGDLYFDLAQVMQKVAGMEEVTITVLTGTGRYFSAGADVSSALGDGKGDNERKHFLRRLAANNMEVTKAFFEHPKILVVALNGPAVGLSAALVAMADFVYATEKTFILTPFTSLGLVAEGGSSYMFLRRMGAAKAHEALLLSKRIPAADLLACGFVNKVFPEEGFRERVLEFVDDAMGDHLVHGSMLGVKKLMRDGMRKDLESASVREAFASIERFLSGVPQREFVCHPPPSLPPYVFAWLVLIGVGSRRGSRMGRRSINCEG